MKILCSKCKNHFEESNLESDSEYKVQCPKCGNKFKIETKRTKVKLPFNYKTRIEEPSKDLVIEKRGDGLISYLILGVGIIFLSTPIISNIENIGNIFSGLFVTHEIDIRGFLVLTGYYTITTLVIALAYLNIVNTVEFRVGKQGINVFVHSHKWVVPTKSRHYAADEINQIFIKKQPYSDPHYMYHLYMRFHDGSDIEIGIFKSFNEARGLEVLIEKRLGIEDREIEGEELP